MVDADLLIPKEPYYGRTKGLITHILKYFRYTISLGQAYLLDNCRYKL